jgi:putative endonuclease
VYILKSLKNNRFYIGSTNNLERRIEQHISGLSKYTKQILPVVLVFQQKYPLLNQARKIEHWLKKQKSSSLINQIVLEGIINKKI